MRTDVHRFYRPFVWIFFQRIKGIDIGSNYLSQPEGAHYPHTVVRATPDFQTLQHPASQFSIHISYQNYLCACGCSIITQAKIILQWTCFDYKFRIMFKSKSSFCSKMPLNLKYLEMSQNSSNLSVEMWIICNSVWPCFSHHNSTRNLRSHITNHALKILEYM